MKYTTELLIILLISIGLAILLPGFMLSSKSIILRSMTELVMTSLGLFVLLSLAFFAFNKRQM